MGSNRTFMELKLFSVHPFSYLRSCSNRTFMELKLINRRPKCGDMRVLIVPLWN